MRKTTRPFQQVGFTALELMVVLIVGLSIIALAASRMDVLFGKSSVAEELSNIQSLAAATRTLKSGGAYGDDLVKTLGTTGGIPSNMGYNATSFKLTNSFGGDVTIVKNATSSSFYDIAYTSVPKSACIDLSLQISKTGTFQTIKAETTAITSASTAADAASACSKDINTIVMTSKS